MRHFSQRQSVTSPQLGQGNFTAPSPGRIVLPHHEQVGIRIIFSVTTGVAVELNFSHFGFLQRTRLATINSLLGYDDMVLF